MCVACRCIRQVSARTPASLISAVSCARLQPPLPVRGRERHGAPLLINLLVGNVKGKETRACVNAGKRRGKKRKLEAATFSVLYRAKIFRGWKFYSWAETKMLRCHLALLSAEEIFLDQNSSAFTLRHLSPSHKENLQLCASNEFTCGQVKHVADFLLHGYDILHDGCQALT